MSTQNPALEQEYKQSPYAVGERDIKSIIADLSKPLPRRLLQSKTVGGRDILFIPWHTAVKILDFRAPGWTWEITHMIHLAGRVAMTGRLTIPASIGVDADGNNVVHYYYRDASGTEIDEKDTYGDPVSNSESMCLRRAAAKFGLGLGLYTPANPQQGQSQNQSQNQGQGQSQSQSSGQQRASTAPGITPKQLGYARKLAGDAGVDENAISQQLFRCDATELTVPDGIKLIDHLKALPPAQPSGDFGQGGDDHWSGVF